MQALDSIDCWHYIRWQVMCNFYTYCVLYSRISAWLGILNAKVNKKMYLNNIFGLFLSYEIYEINESTFTLIPITWSDSSHKLITIRISPFFQKAEHTTDLLHWYFYALVSQVRWYIVKYVLWSLLICYKHLTIRTWIKIKHKCDVIVIFQCSTFII